MTTPKPPKTVKAKVDTDAQAAALQTKADPGEGLQVFPGIQGDGTLTPPVVPPGHIRVRVLRQVEHDGHLYGPGQLAGDEINMPASQAEALQPTGAIERM